MARFLLIEDDQNLTRLVSKWLEAQKHHVRVKNTGAEARCELKLDDFDIVLMDWDLPDAKGPDLCREYRDAGGMAPILMLTGRKELADKEVGFESGADDYLVKPFQPKELDLRLKALLRRVTRQTGEMQVVSPTEPKEAAVPAPAKEPMQPSLSPPSLGEEERYEIKGLLGSGAMGVVFRATDKLLRRQVAMKVLQHARQKEAVERFRIEAQAIAQMSHPNIVTIFDFGVSRDNQIFLIMEYLDGQSLDAVLHIEHQLPLARAMPIFRQLCEALMHAHARGIIHRDLKPSNIILLKKEDGTDLVKLVDFGIVKLMDNADLQISGMTKYGQIFGSPRYMSPEQFLGQPVDERSDIFSLGYIFYECLTGIKLFLGDDDFECMERRLSEKPLPLKTVRPDLAFPDGLEELILRMLEVDFSRRFDSMQSVKEALEALG